MVRPSTSTVSSAASGIGRAESNRSASICADRVAHLMTAFVTSGAGFLLAVLWFDLMFDVQVLRNPARRGALDSVSAYYRRVTTTARPMNLLVGAVMAGTLAAVVAQVVGDEAPDWAAWASLALAGTAIGLAAVHTFPA